MRHTRFLLVLLSCIVLHGASINKGDTVEHSIAQLGPEDSSAVVAEKEFDEAKLLYAERNEKTVQEGKACCESEEYQGRTGLIINKRRESSFETGGRKFDGREGIATHYATRSIKDCKIASSVIGGEKIGI